MDMAKFIKPFKGVPEGEIYPKQYEVGEDCPPELEDGARAMKALGKADKASKADDASAAEGTQGAADGAADGSADAK
jgi:hypothetical protein